MSAREGPWFGGAVVGIVAVLVSTSLPPVYAQEVGLEARVDQLFAQWDRPDRPGCAVSVLRDGRAVYARGYGSANLEYDIPITPTSVFHVASISKQFTAMAVALLVAEGRVSWDDDIRRYVSEVPGFDAPITLRQLAHHTSGLRDQWSLLRMAGWRWEEDVVRQADVLDLTSRQRALNFESGSAFLYSNTGYTLLAVVVERVSGQSLREFAAERIFGPLEMTATAFHDDHTAIVRNRAYAYVLGDDDAYHISIPDFDTVGATSLFTTVEDLARWDRNFYTGEVGGRLVLDDLHRPGTLNDGRIISYAVGLTHGIYRGHATVGHGGADAGYRAEFLRFPDQQLSFAVLCNLASSDPGRLIRAVADIYLESATSVAGGTPAPWSGSAALADGAAGPGGVGPAVSPQGEGQLEALTGLYRRDESDAPLQLVVRNGVLRILSGGGAASDFVPVGPDRFRLAGSSAEGVFDRTAGADGSLLLRLSGAAGGDFTQEPRWRPSTEELTRFVGSYYSDELGVQYALSVDAGRLIMRQRRLGALALLPTYPDGFFTSGFYLAFTHGADDTVDGFTISTARAWKVRFDRQ
jgi:CubicO group peptidase (beta-lactamase class C family)